MPTAHTSQTPASGDVNNGAAITTGVRFTVVDATPIVGIAFWVPGTNSGTYTGGLYQTTTDDDPADSGTGTLLRTASVSSASVTAGGWGVIPITPYTPSAGVIYTAAVHSSSGRIVATGAGLVSEISNGGVTLLAAGTDPNPPAIGSVTNGVFVEGAALAYPASQFNHTDYFVDVVLQTTSTVTGTAAANLGALAGSASGTRTLAGVAVATLGALSGAAVAKRTVSGAAVAALGALATPAVGRRTVGGAATAALGGLAASYFSRTTGRAIITQTRAVRLTTVTKGAP